MAQVVAPRAAADTQISQPLRQHNLCSTLGGEWCQSQRLTVLVEMKQFTRAGTQIEFTFELGHPVRTDIELSDFVLIGRPGRRARIQTGLCAELLHREP